MKFKYKEQNHEGKIVEGIAESQDTFSLAKEIRERNGIPISIKELNNNKLFSLNFSFLKKVSLSEKIMFTNNLSGMLFAGLSLTRALTVLEKQTTNSSFKDVLGGLIDEVNKGGTLSSGMKKYSNVFNSVFVSMVRAGEESGSLPKTLSEIGINLKKTYDLNRKIKGALIYPSVIIVVIIIIAILMMVYVVPTLTATFKDIGVELPVATKIIIFISDFLSQHFLLTVFIILVLIIGFIYFSRSKITKKYFDFISIRIPVIGVMIKETNTARTARTLSSLLGSGVDVSHALIITEDVLQNIYYKELIHNAIISIEKGVPISVSFKANTNLYPIMVGEMIEVGEETGNLSKMLSDIASFYETEVDNKTKNLSTVIEPVLMIFIGIAVGFFAVGMLKPMYSVMDNIQ